MQTVGENSGQVFYKTDNGEYEPLRIARNFSLDPEGISSDDCMKLTKEREMEFELTEEGKKLIENIRRLIKLCDGITKLAKRTVLCNNWRRMHHLPLIRKNRWKKAMGKTSISWIKDLQKLGEEMH